MALITYKDILFIINPNAGSRNIKKLRGRLISMAPEISCIITYDLQQLEEVFMENIDHYKAFILVGGDGTVHEVLKYLYNRNDKLLGVYPAGSGNGFARELGFRKCIRPLISDVIIGEAKEIDVLSIHGEMCINVAGLGYDSYVAQQFQRSKSRGIIKYILLSIRSVFTFKPFRATLIIDQQKVEGVFHMITIANTRQFGNHAIISPLSRPDDGMFELILVKPFPWYLYPVFVVRMFSGSLSESRYIKFMKVKDRVEIKSECKQYHIDGEPRVFRGRTTVRMLSGKVRVIKTRYMNI